MRVTIIVEDGLVAVDGVAYRGLDLSTVAAGRRELVADVPVPQPVAVEAEALAPVEAVPEGVDLVDTAPVEPAPLVTVLATRVHAVQWFESAGHVEEYDAATGEALPNRSIASLDEFRPALDAWDAAHKAATTPPTLTMADIRAKGLAEVDQMHQATLLRLTGTPTDAERNTWAGKVELAKAVLAGAELRVDQEAFLMARGLDTPAKRKAYADEVMANSARYWTLVGMADKVRSEARARIMAVQTMSGWAACGAANRAAAAAAIAEAMAGQAGGA